jgi:hypothetical protein
MNSKEALEQAFYKLFINPVPLPADSVPRVNDIRYCGVTLNEAAAKDTTALMLQAMLREKIAHSLCDSGMIYGYRYQRNRQRDWSQVPTGSLTVHGKVDLDDEDRQVVQSLEINTTLELYPYLYDNLKYDAFTDALWHLWQEEVWADNAESNYYHNSTTTVEYFLQHVRPYLELWVRQMLTGAADLPTWQTLRQRHKAEYNSQHLEVESRLESESMLNQAYRYVTYNDYRHDDTFANGVAVSLHNGCDICGGYTEYVFFYFDDRREGFDDTETAYLRCSHCGAEWRVESYSSRIPPECSGSVAITIEDMVKLNLVTPQRFLDYMVSRRVLYEVKGSAKYKEKVKELWESERQYFFPEDTPATLDRLLTVRDAEALQLKGRNLVLPNNVDLDKALDAFVTDIEGDFGNYVSGHLCCPVCSKGVIEL